MTVVLVEQNTRRADKLAEELNGEYSLVGVNAEVVSFLDETL